MNPDPASLANLRDIVTPPPVPWWPPAPGWWLLMMVSGLIAVIVAVHRWRCWRAGAYRRAALRALRGAEDTTSIAEILRAPVDMAEVRTSFVTAFADVFGVRIRRAVIEGTP